MSGPRNESAEDLVTRAVAATRCLPLASGPSAAIQSQTLAALHEAARRPKVALLERIIHMPWISKAAVLAVAASALVAYAVLSNFAGGSQAFAAVVEALNNVRSATWKTTTVVTRPNNETITWEAIGMFLAPSHERTEITAQGAKTIQILDGEKDKVITLIPGTKTVIVVNVKNIPADRESPYGKTFEGLRELVARAQEGKADKVERLDAETIDGRRAEGFRLQLGSVEVKIWADPTTMLPVRVEETTSEGTAVHIVMTDFQVGMDLDQSLFSLEVPEGYTVGQTAEIDLARMAKNPMSYLADVLKMIAEQNDGVFPAALRGEQGIDGILQRRGAKMFGQKRPKDSAELMKLTTDLSMKLGGAFGFLGALSADNNDWHYVGRDVKLNAPNTPIFWYKPHKASASYQVLYADLSVKEVPSEEAPKAPAAEGSPKP